MYSTQINRFYTIILVTLIAIYLVIIAGSIVRSTGSGMGCPDWPKCFGTYIPPTQESDLPADYKERYTVKGHPAEFNVYKTWTEYGNRLLGALLGLFVLFQCVYAIKFFKSKPKFFWYSLLLVFLMGIQGLLGAKVVSSYLTPVLITLHMGVALIILGIQIWLLIAVLMVKKENQAIIPSLVLPAKYKRIMWFLIALTTLQLFLGTEVREAIDVISYDLGYQFKDTWIERLGTIFLVHRSYSIILTLTTLYVTFLLHKQRDVYSTAYQYVWAINVIMGMEIVAGIVLAYFALPSWIQPIHLLLATLLLGAQMAFVFRFMIGQNRRSA